MSDSKKFRNNILFHLTLALLFTFSKQLGALFEVLGWFFLGVVMLGILAACIFVPLLLIGDRKLEKLLKSYEGKYFLIYSSNKRIKKIVDTELRPLLDKEYVLIYKNREEIKTWIEGELCDHVLWKTDAVKFPRWIKIEHEKLLSVSFYPEVYKLKCQEIDREEFKRLVQLKLKTI